MHISRTAHEDASYRNEQFARMLQALNRTGTFFNKEGSWNENGSK
ncbi:hypothetical protein ACLIBH_01455 [Virgibacillus sp. W0430]